jgi:hypothetical protein
MTRAKFIAAAIAVVLFVGAGAFWLGMREGMQVGVMLDSVPRGAIALHHLNALDAGKTANMRIGLEGEVDMAMIWSYRMEKYPLHALLEPVWGYPMHYHADYLQRLANHRKTTPSPLRAGALANEPVAHGEEARAAREYVLEGARENDRIIQLMIKQHSDDPKTAGP